MHSNYGRDAQSNNGIGDINNMNRNGNYNQSRWSSSVCTRIIYVHSLHCSIVIRLNVTVSHLLGVHLQMDHLIYRSFDCIAQNEDNAVHSNRDCSDSTASVQYPFISLHLHSVFCTAHFSLHCKLIRFPFCFTSLSMSPLSE